VGTKYAMWAGDVTRNKEIKYSGTGDDRGPILSFSGGLGTTIINVYADEDVNMDNKVMWTGTGNDPAIILNNLGGVSTATKQSQVP
jgi:hypothetical protein